MAKYSSFSAPDPPEGPKLRSNLGFKLYLWVPVVILVIVLVTFLILSAAQNPSPSGVGLPAPAQAQSSTALAVPEASSTPAEQVQRFLNFDRATTFFTRNNIHLTPQRISNATILRNFNFFWQSACADSSYWKQWLGGFIDIRSKFYRTIGSAPPVRCSSYFEENLPQEWGTDFPSPRSIRLKINGPLADVPNAAVFSFVFVSAPSNSPISGEGLWLLADSNE